MGQTRSTEVYCYYAEGDTIPVPRSLDLNSWILDTIEKNILDLAARRGLSLYTKENSTGTVNVSTFVADQEKKIEAPTKKKTGKAQKGDFISRSVSSTLNYSYKLINLLESTICWRFSSPTCMRTSSI